MCACGSVLHKSCRVSRTLILSPLSSFHAPLLFNRSTQAGPGGCRSYREASIPSYRQQASSATHQARTHVEKINPQCFLILLVRAGKRNERARHAITPSQDLDLCTCNVKLRAIRGRSRVQRQMLNAEQVFTRWRVGRDRHSRSLRVLARPRDVFGVSPWARGDDCRLCVNFEPDLSRAVPVCCSLSGGYFGEVELQRSRMSKVGGDSEGEVAARVHVLGCRSASTGIQLIAADQW